MERRLAAILATDVVGYSPESRMPEIGTSGSMSGEGKRGHGKPD